MTIIRYEEFASAVTRARLGIGAAELHGSVTGYLCAGWAGPARELLAALELEGDDAGTGDLHALLGPLAAGIAGDLRTGAAVQPLLPATPLQARADGVVDWCRGFLGGLGLTGVLAGPGRVDPAAGELLDAFAHIGAMRIECDEGEDGALVEVLNFIRGGVTHLHAMLAPGDGR